jgi:hypothetical protein
MTRVPFSPGFFSMELKRRALQPIASRKSIQSVVRTEGPDWFDSEGPPDEREGCLCLPRPRAFSS